MVELPGSKARGKLNDVESVVKRSWSAHRLNSSKNPAGFTNEKSSTQHPFKFTTLTESGKDLPKPRIYSATATVRKITVKCLC